MKAKIWKNRWELGAYLQEWRLKRGLTMRNLAPQMQVSLQWLALIERGGVVSPKVSTLRIMADTYGIAFDTLIDIYFPRKKKREAVKPLRQEQDVLQ